MSKSKVNGDFASVIEQSGIKAGDAGFQINVAGNTGLTGAVISSTPVAIAENKNSLTTATLTTSDIQNKDNFSASGYGFSLSGGIKLGDQTSAAAKSDMAQMTDKQQAAANAPAKPGASAGVGSASGSQSSTTESGISAAAVTITDAAKQQAVTGQDAATTVASLNRDVSTDKDSSNALTKAWDGQALQQDVQTQAQITQAFSQVAPKAVADFAASQTKAYESAQMLRDEIQQKLTNETDLDKRGSLQAALSQAEQTMADNQATYDLWKEGGSARVALHTAVGALGGGVSGAVGAATIAAAAPLLEDMQKKAEDTLVAQGYNPETAKAMAQTLGQLASAGIGATVGGTQGAATSLTVDTNNRMLTHSEIERIKELANGDPKRSYKLTAAACAIAKCYAEYPEGSTKYIYYSKLASDGANFTDEILELMREPDAITLKLIPGIPVPVPVIENLFESTRFNAATDKLFLVNNTYSVTDRALGTLQVAGGVVGTVSGGITTVATAPACTTIVGCAAPVVAGAFTLYSFDNVITGGKTIWTGETANTWTNTYLLQQSLGLSPQAAAYTEIGLGLGLGVSSVKAAGMVGARKAADEVIIAEKNVVDPALTQGSLVDTVPVIKNVPRGGKIELFTDASGPKVPGAIGVGPTDATAIAKDARSMPNIPSNSQEMVIANNPYISKSGGGNFVMMDYLPEATRITQPGGKIVINANEGNKYFTNLPSSTQLDALGLKIEYQGALLPEYRNMTFFRSNGSPLPIDTMKTIVFVKK